MVDSTAAQPEELTIGQVDGIFTLENDATIKTTYDVNIVITTTDGTNVQTLQVSDIAVEKICGLESTTLTAPTMNSLYQAPNLQPLLTIGGEFLTSNANCPVVQNELTTSAADFDFVDKTDLAAGTHDFEMTMTSAANAAVATYDYQVKATAEGDASEVVDASMLIELVCVAELESAFNKSISFDIPEFVSQRELTPASIDYVTAPPYPDASGFTYGLPLAYQCSQTFSFRMSTGDAPPVEMELDSATGIFEVLNYASDTQRYEIEIDIMTTDTVNDYPLTLSGVVVSTVCGPESTTLTAPELDALFKVPNIEPLLSISGTFTTSNPTCPVISHDLLIGVDAYELTDEGASFTLTMEDDDDEFE